MAEDIAITSSKSDVNPCSHGRDPDRQKSADRQTDGQTAFQLYIVDTAFRFHYMAPAIDGVGRSGFSISNQEHHQRRLK